MKYLALVLALITFNAFSQEESIENVNFKKYKHSIGLGAGFSTGVGFSYRYFPKRFGAQITVGPFYSNHGENARISTGFTFLYNIVEGDYTCLYAYFGNHYLYYSDTYNDGYFTYDINNNPIWNEPKTYIEKYYNNGLGLGFEFNTRKKVTFNIMAGYGNYKTFEYSMLTGEIALYYRFN